MPEKTLIADLPRMRGADLARFEKEGGVWGRQRAIRRNQLYVQGAVTFSSVLTGAWYTKFVRRNTWLVVVGTFPMFFIFGAVVGNSIGKEIYPSVANNQETTQMRLAWWARECSKKWNYSQIDEGTWKAQYPNSAVPGSEVTAE